jgi:hypothetical protein
VRDDATTRGEDAAIIEATIEKALGDRLHEEDSHALHAAVTDWVHARGDWWTGALAWGPADSARGVWLRTPAASPDASSRAVRELVDLTHRRALQELLAGSLHLSPGAVRSVDAPPVGKASLATFSDPTAGGSRKPEGVLGVAWGVHDGELLVAAGAAAPQLLSAEAAPTRKVGDDPRAARALLALGQRATFAVFAEPLRLDPARGEPDAASPAVFAWGRKGDGVWARLELADLLLRELLRLKAGL